MAWSCSTADSGGDGAAGGIPQLLLGSVVVVNSGAGLLSSAKVQPSLVSIVVVVVMSLILGVGLLRVFLVELADKVG